MIKGILFDKDGTILDFYKMWFQLSADAIRDVAVLYNCTEKLNEMLASVGIHGTILEPGSVLACGTYPQIAQSIYKIMFPEKDMPESFLNELMQVTKKYVLQSDPIPTCDLRKTFDLLHKMGLKLGLATADETENALYCLRKLNIIDAFDYLGTDDGKIAPKPAPDLLIRFAEIFKLQPHEIAMVGDTVSDMRFAKNAGAIAIGVTCGVTKKEELEPYADLILSSPEKLPDRLAQLQ